MKPTVLRERATTPDGRQLTLHEHDGAFMIRVDGVELMSTRRHRSEEMLAAAVCARLGHRTRTCRLLIGGLGFGFTLRAALGLIGPEARVTVAELVPAVVRWNLTPEYGLAHEALADPRVEIVVGDVAALLRSTSGRFDAVILDVDNGARGLSMAANDALYTQVGLATAAAALAPGGCLAIWSADEDPACVRRMQRGGFDVMVERAPTHGGGGGWNYLLLGVAGRQPSPRDAPARGSA